MLAAMSLTQVHNILCGPCAPHANETCRATLLTRELGFPRTEQVRLGFSSLQAWYFPKVSNAMLVKVEVLMRANVSFRIYQLEFLKPPSSPLNCAGFARARAGIVSCRMADAPVEHADAAKPKDPTKPEMPKLLRTLSKGYQKSMNKTRDNFKKAFLTPRGARGPGKTDGEAAAPAEAQAEPEVLYLQLLQACMGDDASRADQCDSGHHKRASACAGPCQACGKWHCAHADIREGNSPGQQRGGPCRDQAGACA
jgi:hypothetical protein